MMCVLVGCVSKSRGFPSPGLHILSIFFFFFVSIRGVSDTSVTCAFANSDCAF